MYSRIFGPKEDDDYDEIFNLDAIDCRPEDYCTVSGNRQVASNEIETALQTPRYDIFCEKGKVSQMFKTNFLNYAPLSSDSAVWTESQMTKNTTVSNQYLPERFNRITDEHLDGRGGSFRPSLNRERDNMFLSTQEEMDVTCLIQSNNNVHRSSSDNFVNYVNSLEDNFEQPSSSFQQALLTPTIEDIPTQSLHFNNCTGNWSQEVPVPTGGSNDDFCLRLDESQHDTQSQEQHCSAILSNLDRLNTFSIPESVFDLYKQIKGGDLSDWSFVYALSAQTCQEFMPMNYNITLKICLLLSIASIDTVSF